MVRLKQVLRWLFSQPGHSSLLSLWVGEHPTPPVPCDEHPQSSATRSGSLGRRGQQPRLVLSALPEAWLASVAAWKHSAPLKGAVGSRVLLSVGLSVDCGWSETQPLVCRPQELL